MRWRRSPLAPGRLPLAEVKRGASYTLKARPEYAWGPNGSHHRRWPDFPPRWFLRLIENQSTAANLLITGELDTAYIFGQDVERLGARERAHPAGTRSRSAPRALTFHQGEGHPTADPKVRRALAMAIDGASYNRAAYFGLARTMHTLTTPTMDCLR